MKLLKTVLVISLAVLFHVACGGSETTNGNANRTGTNSNANRSAAVIDNANAGSAAQTSAAGNANNSATATTATSSIDAVALFKANKCNTCHGDDGKGKTKGTPNFSNAEWQAKESDEELAEKIKKGEPPKMPAFESKLKEGEIKALVAYVRSFGKK